MCTGGAPWYCIYQDGQGSDEAAECTKGRRGEGVSAKVLSMKTKQDKEEGSNKNNNNHPGSMNTPILRNKIQPHARTNPISCS